MTSLLNSSQDILNYHEHSIDNAIVRITTILEKYNDHPHAFEYYSALHETLIALSFAMHECRAYSKMYGKLLARIENIEHLFSLERKRA